MPHNKTISSLQQQVSELKNIIEPLQAEILKYQEMIMSENKSQFERIAEDLSPAQKAVLERKMSDKSPIEARQELEDLSAFLPQKPTGTFPKFPTLNTQQKEEKLSDKILNSYDITI